MPRKPTKLGISSNITDVVLCATLLARVRLTDVQRREVAETKTALERGRIDALAARTRDRYFALARASGVYSGSTENLSAEAFKNKREVQREKTKGEEDAASALSQENLALALARRPPLRRPA